LLWCNTDVGGPGQSGAGAFLIPRFARQRAALHWLPNRNDTVECEFFPAQEKIMASARLKPGPGRQSDRDEPRHPVHLSRLHVPTPQGGPNLREGAKRRSLAAGAVHRSVGSHQRMNDRAERGGSLPVFGAALLVLAVVGFAVITGFMP